METMDMIEETDISLEELTKQLQQFFYYKVLVLTYEYVFVK